MGRPSYKWTDDQLAQLKAGWESGSSIETISNDIGASFSNTRRKIKEMGLVREAIPKIARGRSQDASWDDWLFESYADRKARLARERKNG